MATKRRPPAPPKKQPSPPPPPHSDGGVDEDVRSSSEEEPEVEQDRKPLESEASDDDGEETGGDEIGEDEDDSESETDQLAPNPPRQRDDDAGDEDDDDGDTDESGEEDSEYEEEQPNPSSQNANVARPAEANGNPSGEKSLPVSESDSEEEDSESDEVLKNPSQRSSALTHPANVNGNPSDKKSMPVSQSEEDDSESEEVPPSPSPRNPAIANGNPLDKKSVPASDAVKVAVTPLKAATGETAKKLFQRIWSDEDQIALLQGMVDYVGTKAKDPAANIKDFGLFIRKKLSFSVTQSQLMSKIHTVKKKYISRSKSINKGKERPFQKEYDAEVFELSKKVWGAAVKNGENGGIEKRKGVPLDNEAVRDSPSNELLFGMPWEDEVINLCKEHFGCDEYSAMAKMKSMEESEWKSLMPRWKKLKMDEVRCFENRRSLELDTLKTFFNSS